MKYILEQVTFDHFFMATKHILGDLIIGCNPYTQKFFKIKDLYVALSYDSSIKNLHIDMMAGKGGLELFEQIRLTGINAGAETISWNTSTKNTKVNKLAKFYKACKISEVTNFYPDGSDCIVYQLSLV